MSRATNPIHARSRAGDDVRHSREKALTEREFEQFLAGARDLADSCYYYEHDPEMIAYVLGRLGLRRGELVHLREDWIDWREEMIRIPDHSECTMGEGGSKCGYCRQLAQQRADYNDDLDYQTALEWTWVPKTQAAARDVYFGWSTRVALALERYFAGPYDRFEASGTAVGRRVDRVADLAPTDLGTVHPHALRATAATYHAGRGLSASGLMQMMGWCQMQTAEVYISRNSQNTSRQLDAIHQH